MSDITMYMTTDRSIWITTDNVIVTGKHKVDL